MQVSSSPVECLHLFWCPLYRCASLHYIMTTLLALRWKYAKLTYLFFQYGCTSFVESDARSWIVNNLLCSIVGVCTLQFCSETAICCLHYECCSSSLSMESFNFQLNYDNSAFRLQSCFTISYVGVRGIYINDSSFIAIHCLVDISQTILTDNMT